MVCVVDLLPLQSGVSNHFGGRVYALSDARPLRPPCSRCCTRASDAPRHSAAMDNVRFLLSVHQHVISTPYPNVSFLLTTSVLFWVWYNGCGPPNRLPTQRQRWWARLRRAWYTRVVVGGVEGVMGLFLLYSRSSLINSPCSRGVTKCGTRITCGQESSSGAIIIRRPKHMHISNPMDVLHRGLQAHEHSRTSLRSQHSVLDTAFRSE